MYGSSGPSSKVIATSRSSRGPFPTCEPNQFAVGELAPIQKTTPAVRTAPPIAAARTAPGARAAPGAGEHAHPGDRRAVQQAGPAVPCTPSTATSTARATIPATAPIAPSRPRSASGAAAQPDPHADPQPEEHGRERDVSLRQQPTRHEHEEATRAAKSRAGPSRRETHHAAAAPSATARAARTTLAGERSAATVGTAGRASAAVASPRNPSVGAESDRWGSEPGSPAGHGYRSSSEGLGAGRGRAGASGGVESCKGLSAQGASVCGRRGRHQRRGARARPQSGKIVAAVVVALWAIVLILILRHRVFVSHDSISNYGHVWFVSDRLWGGDGLPFRMPVIGHGKAFAFPYSFLPWFSASLLYPLLGDWVVTLWLVLGHRVRGRDVLGVPRDPPGLVGGDRAGVSGAGDRADHRAAAVHLGRGDADGGDRLLATPALRGGRDARGARPGYAPGRRVADRGCPRARRAQLGSGRATAPPVLRLSFVIALPATWIVFVSPVFVDSSALVIIGQFFGTLVVRAFVFVVPILLFFFQHVQRRIQKPWLPIALFIFALGLNLALGGILDTRYAWGA